MARKETWTNSDSLIVGNGSRTVEKDDGGEVKTFGGLKQAVMHFDYTTATTVSPHGIVIPAGAAVHSVWIEVLTAWATSDAGKIEVGVIGGDVDAMVDDFDEQSASGGTVGNRVLADGPDVVGDNADNRGIPFQYAAATRIGITKTNNFTAGRARLVVQYA